MSPLAVQYYCDIKICIKTIFFIFIIQRSSLFFCLRPLLYKNWWAISKVKNILCLWWTKVMTKIPEPRNSRGLGSFADILRYVQFFISSLKVFILLVFVKHSFPTDCTFKSIWARVSKWNVLFQHMSYRASCLFVRKFNCFF